MAETTIPPVGGTRRVRVLGLLVTSGGVAAAALGAVGGLVGDALGGPLPAWLAVAVVTSAAVADAAAARTGRPQPWSARRQVPVEWSRLFPPEVAAVLYGARLGVGPLTILSSWLWWAAFAVGAAAGVVAGAVAGVAFALARVGATVAVASGEAGRSGVAMGRRVDHLRGLDARVALVTLAVVVVGALALSACAGDDDDGASPAPPAPTTAGPASTTSGSPGPTTAVPATAAPTTPAPSTGAPVTPTPTDASVALPVTDLLPDLTAATALELPVDAIADLAALLVADGPPGSAAAPDGELGSGPLDLDAAAGAEPDAEAERSLLVTRGFVDGHGRAWTGPGAATALVTLYRFETGAGAGDYLLDGGEHALARGARPVPATLDGAFAFSQVDDTGTIPFVVHAVALVRGPVFALVLVGSPDGAEGPGVAATLAAAQAARLEGAASAR